MQEITIDHKNGHSTTYEIQPSETAYRKGTPKQVIDILENARKYGERLKFNFGNVETGKSWNEEHDIIGRIGRSGGTVKVPLLIHNSRSHGGGEISVDRILKITSTNFGKVVYKASNFQPSVFEIVPSDLKEYSHNVNIDGQLYSRHKTERAAKLLVAKLS